MRVIFEDEAIEQYFDWQLLDKKIATRIKDLIRDIKRNGFMKGIGKPEALRGRKAYSRHIDEANRLIYTGDKDQNLLILSCKGHYDD